LVDLSRKMVIVLGLMAYVFGVVSVLLLGLWLGESSLGWKYYSGLVFMSVIWPYALYRVLGG